MEEGVADGIVGLGFGVGFTPEKMVAEGVKHGVAIAAAAGVFE